MECILTLARKELRKNWLCSMANDINIDCKVEKLGVSGQKLCALFFSYPIFIPFSS